MNYIAHIHIAQYTDTSMLGNFLGDFVKGSQLQHLPTEIEQGVRLHRRVDVYTDQHRAVVELKQAFPKEIRRMAGVAIDIYFDHLLLQHWQRFSQQSCEQTLASFYHDLQKSPLDINSRYTRVRESLLEGQWLAHYIHADTCLRVFQSIEARLHNRVSFASVAWEFLQAHHHLAEQAFLSFYPQLLSYAGQAVQEPPKLII